ncbi:hypothetical protein [Nostoc sp.]
MRLPTRQQQHQQLIEQYVLSRRTMLVKEGKISKLNSKSTNASGMIAA